MNDIYNDMSESDSEQPLSEVAPSEPKPHGRPDGKTDSNRRYRRAAAELSDVKHQNSDNEA